MHYRDSSNSKIDLNKKLASAGEADIYFFNNQNKFLAKIYREKPSDNKRNKLHYILSNSFATLSNFTSVPLNLIFSSTTNDIVGFTMPFLSGVSILNIIQARERIKLFPENKWDFLIHIARNCCIGFDKLHSHSIVMGDVNESNILVNKNATINFIDFDSYQIKKSNNSFYTSDFGVALWTPPELQFKDLKGIVRNENHDSFGLALLIFKLLFMGYHPFAGIPIKKTNTEEYVENAIANHRFAYSKYNYSLNVLPPLNSIDIDIVPNNIKELFERAFSTNGVRPLPLEWIENLDKIKLNACQQDKNHLFSNHLKNCPWCRIMQNGGHAYFLPKFDFRSNLNVDESIKQIWKEILMYSNGITISYDGKINYTITNYKAVKISHAKFNKQNFVFANIYLILILTFFLTDVFNWGYSVFCVLFYLIFIGKFVRNNKYFEELNQRKNNFKNKEKEFSDLLNKYDSDLKTYNKIPSLYLAEISSKIDILKKSYYQYEQLSNFKAKIISDARRDMYSYELKNYLENILIRNYKITGIAEKRISLLESYGIESAFDVTDNMNVPGIGYVNKTALLSWKSEQISRFNFNPNKELPVYIRNKIESEISNLKNKSLLELKNGLLFLKLIHQKSTSQKNFIEMDLNKVKDDLISINIQYQIAKANFEVCDEK